MGNFCPSSLTPPPPPYISPYDTLTSKCHFDAVRNCLACSVPHPATYTNWLTITCCRRSMAGRGGARGEAWFPNCYVRNRIQFAMFSFMYKTVYVCEPHWKYTLTVEASWQLLHSKPLSFRSADWSLRLYCVDESTARSRLSTMGPSKQILVSSKCYEESDWLAGHYLRSKLNNQRNYIRFRLPSLVLFFLLLLLLLFFFFFFYIYSVLRSRVWIKNKGEDKKSWLKTRFGAATFDVRKNKRSKIIIIIITLF